MQTLLIFLYILVAVVLVILILLQQSKGSDIGSAFGGGASNTMFGPSSSFSPLSKVTAVLAFVFLTLSLVITLQSKNPSEELLIESDISSSIEVGELPDSDSD